MKKELKTINIKGNKKSIEDSGYTLDEFIDQLIEYTGNPIRLLKRRIKK